MRISFKKKIDPQGKSITAHDARRSAKRSVRQRTESRLFHSLTSGLRVRKRTDGRRSERQHGRTMQTNPIDSNEVSDSATRSADQPAHPVDVFYIVLSKGDGERDHCLCPPVYETKAGAQTELSRIRAEDAAGNYAIWRSTTYVEPAEWLHRVIRSDGTLILPRVSTAEKVG